MPDGTSRRLTLFHEDTESGSTRARLPPHELRANIDEDVTIETVKAAALAHDGLQVPIRLRNS